MDYIKSRYEVVEGQIDAAITNQPFPFARGEGDATWSVIRGKRRVGVKLTEAQARKMVREMFRAETAERLASLELHCAGLPPDKREPDDLLDMREAVKLMSAEGDWLDGFELDIEIIHGKR